MEAEHRLTMCRGLKTAWLQAGRTDRPLMFLIHGYPDTADCWDEQLRFFAENYCVIAPYARGARPSAATADLRRYGIRASTMDHLQILREIDPSGTKPVICVGHDLGGIQAWELAKHLGPRLKALVIINSLSLFQIKQRMRDWRQLLRSWYVFAFMVPKLSESLIARYPARLLRAAHQMGELSPAKRPPLGKTLPGVVNPVRQYRALAKDLVFAQAGVRLKAPVLILWGNKDRFLETIRRSELDDECFDASIRILRANHWPHREKPDEVNHLIAEFLCQPS